MTTKRNRLDQEPTWTVKIQRFLAQCDDFRNQTQIRAATGASPNQSLAALCHLRKHRVVDSVEADGQLWWFITGEDLRSKVVETRVLEPKGNRTRARVSKPKIGRSTV